MITLPVEKIGDDYVLTFTDDLLEELGWSTGDELDWDIKTDGSIIVTKCEDTPTVGPLYKPLRSLNPLHDC